MENDEYVTTITKLFNLQPEIPEEWPKSVFIPLLKKQCAKPSGGFRQARLMSHGLKIFLRSFMDVSNEKRK